MTTEDFNADDIGPGNLALMRSLIAEGKPDRELSRQALATFCRIARSQRRGASPFPVEMLDWVADAFERQLSGESPDIAKSLGLKPRGKPVDPKIESRNWTIASRVAELIEERPDAPLPDNDAGEGIFADVADELNVSATVVRDVWYLSEEREESYLLKTGEMVREKIRTYPMQEMGRAMLRLVRLPEFRKWQAELDQSPPSRAPDSPKSRD